MSSPQKRIAIYMPSLFGGGGQRSMLNLAHGIADRNCIVDLVLAQVRYLKRERPEAMLSVFGYTNIIALWAWRLAGGPTRLFVNEQNTVSQEAGNASSWRGRLTPQLMKRFYPWANGIVVVSRGVRDDMAELTNIPRERITVIYNPSVVKAEVAEKAQATLDHPWFKPGQPPVLIAVGRLQVQKDYPTMLQAFAKVRRRRPARLLILGEGKKRPALEALIEELGLQQDVRLQGFVPNPYAYMARASLFVLSSRWEGLPTVLIEALCCGTPVVSTDCPSGPQEILRGGRYGQLVPVGDADGLACAIERALDNNAPSPPSDSWQPYDRENIVNQYLNLLIGESMS